MSSALRKFGDYLLIKKIATGGMAEIYLARTRTAYGTEKFVALKMIHPRYMEQSSFQEMIVEEAKIAVRLNHRNIGQVFDLGQVDNHCFLVMEYIDGYDLSRLHEATQKKGMNTPIDVVAYIGREVCAALVYAHQLKDPKGRPLRMIHRDISPQNILLGFSGDVKIIDFGIAKVSTQLRQTQVGVIKGKFYYMSPEQAGARDIDQRSDLFSLGICLWETLSGRSLFRREGGPTNPLAILHEIRTLPIPRVREFRPDCPPALDEIVARALARDLDHRFGTASEMQAALTRFLLNHARSFSQKSLTQHMVQAFEKEETTKERPRLATHVGELLQRKEFRPDANSMIYVLPPGPEATQPPVENPNAIETGPVPRVNEVQHPTHIGLQHHSELDTSDMAATIEPRLLAEPVVGISSVGAQCQTTDQSLRQLSDVDFAMSETVFLRKDDVEEMRRAGAMPSQVSVSPIPPDPNSQTQNISQAQIQETRERYTKQLEKRRALQAQNTKDTEKPVPRRTPHKLPPLTQHPLFRLLVIAMLVLCVLSATMVLLLIRRSRDRARILQEQERVLHKSTADATTTQGTHFLWPEEHATDRPHTRATSFLSSPPGGWE